MVTLGDALGLGDREIVAFVGAGGKTTAMFRLARDLSAGGLRVVVTTTTRIFVPPQSADVRVVVEDDRSALLTAVIETLAQRRIPVAAIGTTAGGKLVGLPPEWIDDLADLRGVAYVLVEADGAARKPFKAPRDDEPVIPAVTTVVVAVVGIDALGEPVSLVAHRPDIVTALTGLAADDRLDAHAMALVISDPRGMTKGAPAGARIVVLVNKADDPVRVGRARELAAALRDRGPVRIVIAALEASDAVIEVSGSPQTAASARSDRRSRR